MTHVERSVQLKQNMAKMISRELVDIVYRGKIEKNLEFEHVAFLLELRP